VVTGDHELRRIAEEIEHDLQSINSTNKIQVVGGRSRQIRIELDSNALASRATTPLDVSWAIEVSNQLLPAGEVQIRDREIAIEAGNFIQDAKELRKLVVNVVNGVPVYLEEVAHIIDGPAEPDNYTWIGLGPASGQSSTDKQVYPAVAVSVSKKKGTNAVRVAEEVENYLETLKKEYFPPEVDYRIIRNYGRTADEKINNLITSLLIAVLTVVVFIGVFLGWRAAVVVGLAVPICYGITLMLDLFAGYTINRVTLFALILSLGLLVDDPITGVDNIKRYLRMSELSRGQAVISAIVEIRIALIMSTIAIILSFAPLRFITGMMGPYMSPMAFNVPVSVIVSTLVAFFVTPWLAYKLIKKPQQVATYDVTQTGVYKVYSRLLNALLCTKRRSWIFLAGVLLLFCVSLLLPLLRLVPLKLLPYDNKNEFQVVIDMPEGTTLERTQGVAAQLCLYLSKVPEIVDYTAFVGIPSPMDFNGMVRHYYLRKGAHFADIRVTLADKRFRSQQSHALLLRLRKDIEAIAERAKARIKLVEVPPGPPVIATITAELYGTRSTDYATLQSAAQVLKNRLKEEPFVVDIDTSVGDDQQKIFFIPDREKAALSGISVEDLSKSLQIAIRGLTVGYIEAQKEVNPLPIILRLPFKERSPLQSLANLYVKGRPGITKQRDKTGLQNSPQPIVPMIELGEVKWTQHDKIIYHKNLKPVVYVFADTAGRPPIDIITDLNSDLNQASSHEQEITPIHRRSFISPGAKRSWNLPNDVNVVWAGEGEWQITRRVLIDLGAAFGVALIGIFLILRIQTGFSIITGIIMLAIPLSMIGILPGFWFLNHLGTRVVDGYPDPILFTATAMIGMIALAGIVVRNSLILVEFIHMALREGKGLLEALIEAGAVRLRPIFLTAGTTLLGNLVITLDPIFSGLAWSIIFGILASTVFTLFVVPTVYYLIYRDKSGNGLPAVKQVVD
jgi:multidrug efflux pump subunit AcrB